VITFRGAVQKCSDARRAKNRTARRIFTYVERCGLQCNAADERFSTTHLYINLILNTRAYITLEKLLKSCLEKI
jgi:hypothetical protein